MNKSDTINQWMQEARKRNEQFAFPQTTALDSDGNHYDLGAKGMTLRDYFAAKAMPLAWKIFDEGYSTDALTTENIAEAAYQLADAMLAARKPDPKD